MKKAIGILVFIGSIFFITGGHPYFVINKIRGDIVVGYAIGLLLLYLSSRLIGKQYLTLIIGVAGLLAGVHLILFISIVDLSSQHKLIGMLFSGVLIVIGVVMNIFFIQKRRKARMNG